MGTTKHGYKHLIAALVAVVLIVSGCHTGGILSTACLMIGGAVVGFIATTADRRGS